MTESPSRESGSRASSVTCASLRWDRQECVPLESCLESRDDIVVMLTPLVMPPESQQDITSDPFEPLGQLLAQKHPSIRHVPYSKQNGITRVHVAFIKRAHAVIFVVTGPPSADEPSQLEFADTVAEVCGDTPLILVVCCQIDGAELHRFEFPTVIQARGFSRPDLVEVASVLLGGPVSPAQSSIQAPPTPIASFPWRVQLWDYERDLAETHELWTTNVPPQFRLSQDALGGLLKRDGFAMHHVVRTPNGQVAGFCATYTTYANSVGHLVGSIAAVIVREELRHQNIGRILYDEALSKLGKIRGLHYLHLGTTFPRLLYGIPAGHAEMGWIERRQWTIGERTPGRGRVMRDWVLQFSEAPNLDLASAGLNFRPCEMEDFPHVIAMVESESGRKFGFGWCDQYYGVLQFNGHAGNVLLGFEGATLVASAITYTCTDGSQAAEDLPWAGYLAPDLGGVTCICIKDDDPEMINRRDTVLIRLLFASCRMLSERGASGVFVDCINGNESGFEMLGFRKWAEYQDIWRRVNV